MRRQRKLLLRHVDDGGVQFARGHPIDQRVGITFADQKLDFRISRRDLRGRRGERALRRRRYHADTHAARYLAVEARHFLPGTLNFLRDGAGEAYQGFPRRCQ